MITLSVIDIIVFTEKLVCFACGAAWGITETVLLAMGIPTLLLAAVLWPVLEGI